MGAVLSRVGRDLRRAWRSWSALVLISGVLGGAVIGLTSGARRTERAYPDFLVSQRAFQQFMFTTEFYEGTAGVSADQLAGLSTVEAVTPGMVFDGSPSMVMRGGVDDRLDRTLNKVNVLAGRLPDPAEPYEILVPLLLAEHEQLQVGDVLPFRLRTGGAMFGPKIEARVVGIGVAPGEFPPENDILTTRWVHVTPAFVRRHADAGAPFAYVFLKNGDRDLDAFQRELTALTQGAPVIGYQQASLTKNVTRAFRLQAVSLVVLAMMLGATALALIAQTVSRMTWLEARDHPVLSAVGMTRRQLTMVGLLRVGVVAVVAALLAVVVAFLLSPLMPTGRARLAVIDPGFTFDGWVSVLGAFGLVVVMLALAVVPAYRSARLRRSAVAGVEQRSHLADALQRSGLSPAASIGVRFALERGRGSTAVPTRATILGAAIAVAAIALTLTFGAGLDHLLETPRLYGSVYDLIGGPSEVATSADGDDLVAKLRAVPGIDDVTHGAIGLPFRVDGALADGEAIDPDARAFLPPLLTGRYPRGPNEILLGPGTLRTIDREVGETVAFSALGTGSTTFTIVGSGVVPTVGHSANLGEGSLVSLDAARAIFGDDSMGNILIRLEEGASVDAVAAEVRRIAGPLLSDVTEPLEPGDLVSFGGQRNLPSVLAAILASIAVLTIAHALLSTIARRRKDLAILRAAGFTTAQSRRTVAWQSSALAVVGLTIGLPAGVAAGRWLWLTYARQLGVLPEARVPVVLAILTVPAALLLANVVAWWPARRAARIAPAAILRAE